MKNKNLYIGLGVLAVAGIGFYMWKKKKDSGDDSTTETKEKSSFRGNPNMPHDSMCVKINIPTIKQ